ncbi:MAG: FKBP-type peptidyl-prolyl cis-trans isomerase [Treponema sp.]|nr:FKBP-type peptidyl-prolyl cis-trans isomerase [Treponema sp.]
MKKTVIFACLFLSALVLHARAIQEDYRTSEEKQRVSYAFGMVIGSNLRSAPVEFDYNAFAQGVRAMIEENVEPQFTEQEAMEIVETALHEAMERVSENNRQLEEEFLASNAQRPGVIVTESGLQYEIIENAEGPKPSGDSVVRVHYTGTFIDGRLFDRSTEEEGAFIPLELVIRGWTEGLMLMSPGSNYRLFIPSNLAYGTEGIQSIIPPYSTLIFTVELLEIVDSGDY